MFTRYYEPPDAAWLQRYLAAPTPLKGRAEKEAKLAELRKASSDAQKA